jgi:hypothetical protein
MRINRNLPKMDELYAQCKQRDSPPESVLFCFVPNTRSNCYSRGRSSSVRAEDYAGGGFA